MKFPNFFVVGAGKCGTTTLYHFLNQHPDVYMSPIKEPNHFCTDFKPEEFSEENKAIERSKNINIEKYVNGPMDVSRFGYFVTNPVHYKLLFKNVKNEKAIGEISNAYLFSEVAAQNIKNEVPDAKIIIILRNPVERLISHYKANIRDGRAILPFMEEINNDYNKPRKGWKISAGYYEQGLYYNQVERYIRTFGKDKVKIFWFEELIKDPAKVAHDLFSFLDVDPNVKIDTEEKQNVSWEPKSKKLVYFLSKSGIKRPLLRLFPASMRKNVKGVFFNKNNSIVVSAEEKNKVLEFYKEDILKLQSIVDKDLSQWLIPKS